MKKIAFGLLFLGVVCCVSFRVFAIETLSPADVLDEEQWTVSVLGVSEKTKPSVRISGTDGVSVPTTGGTSTVFSDTNADVSMTEKAKQIGFRLAFRPDEGLEYQLSVARIRDLELSFSSGSLTNKLLASNDGTAIGLGLKGRIVPGSMVSTAIGWSLSATRRWVDLDTFQSNGTTSAADLKLDQDEYQATLSASHRWKQIEPYAGLKFLRMQTRLTDTETKSQVAGHADSLNPYVGLQWSFSEKEAFTFEASFGQAQEVAAGLQIRFDHEQHEKS